MRRGQEIVRKLRGEYRESDTPRSLFADPRIGVALGGGSARGMVHVPFIEAMDELGLRPHVIAGTSIGALIGAGWASGMTGKELRDHSISVLGTLKIIAGRLWGAQIRNLGSIFQSGFSVQLDAGRVTDAFLPDPFPTEFQQLRTPLFVVATDFQSWHQAVFSEGELRMAIAGSIAIPTLFRPVVFANHLLVDGCVVNPLPLDQAAPGSDILVGIDANGDPSVQLNKTNHNLLDTWFGSAQIMMHALIAHTIAAYPPDVYARPHVTNFGAMEFWRVREIFEHVERDKEVLKRQLALKIEAHILHQQEVATGGA
jgi:NTE family protein